jgi:hypothetical protein
MAMFRNAGRLGMANPFSQRLLEDFAQPQAARPFGAGGRRGKAMPFNVTGQPERTPEGLINRPSPVYNRPAFTPPPTPISFVSGLPQVTDFQSEAPATAGPATLGNPFDFASVMGENTVPKMNAEQYLRGPLPTGQGIRPEEDSLAGTGQSPYLQRSEDAYRTGISQLQSGLGEQDRLARQATGTFLGRLGETDRIQRGATDEFGRRLGDIERFGGQVYDRFGADVSDMVGTARGAADEFGQRLGDVERLGGQVYDRFGRDISDVVGTAAGTVGRLGQRLGESGDLLRQTTGAFDPSMTEQFYDPFEERVVQQTISDALEAGDKADISQRAKDIARGGESAFGSRARLGAEERREALGRGLGEALAGIRSRGFGQAQRAAMGEFGRQQQARRAAASGLAGLAGQQYGAGRDFTSTLGGAAGQRLAAGTGYGSLLSGLGAQQLASQQRLAGTLGSAAGQRLSAGTGFGNLLSGIAGQQLGSQRQLAAGLGQTAGQGLQARTGLGSTLGQIGAQRLGAQQGYGGFLSGLGSQAQQAGLTDINTLAGMGGQQQQLSQAQMDAIRANAMQAQQAPLAQYQALLPFIQTAPAGQFQTQTTFAPRPSPLQAGLATGLGTLGALGNFFGGTQRGGFGYAA